MYSWSNKWFKSTIVNRTCHSINRDSLKMKSTVPLSIIVNLTAVRDILIPSWECCEPTDAEELNNIQIIYGTFWFIYRTFRFIYRTFRIIYGTFRIFYGTFWIIYGTFWIIYGTFWFIYGTFRIIYGTFWFIYGTFRIIYDTF